MAISDRQQAIVDSFDYHRPSPEQGDRIGRVRAAFKRTALTVLANTPEGPDQTVALRQLHEAMMTANKAIACEPGTGRVDSFVAEPGLPPGHEPFVRYCCEQHALELDPNPGC